MTDPLPVPLLVVCSQLVLLVAVHERSQHDLVPAGERAKQLIAGLAIAAVGRPLAEIQARITSAASTITAASFTVFTALPVVSPAGSVSYDASSQTAWFTPFSALVAGTTYTAVLTTAITDLSGNPLAMTAGVCVWGGGEGGRLACCRATHWP